MSRFPANGYFTNSYFLKNGPLPASLFHLFNTVGIKLNLILAGFEPQISGAGSDRSTNWATTTARGRLFESNDVAAWANGVNISSQKSVNGKQNTCYVDSFLRVDWTVECAMSSST